MEMQVFTCQSDGWIVDDPNYHFFKIPKRKGGFRVISAPNPSLKERQEKLMRQLIGTLPISPFAHAFRPHHNIITNAIPHVGKKYIMRIDIHEFFHSTTFEMFVEKIKTVQNKIDYHPEKYSKRTKDFCRKVIKDSAFQEHIKRTCFMHVINKESGKHEWILPQGAPTSPVISNFVLSSFDWLVGYTFILNLNDIWIGEEKENPNLDYTRYADDITVSSDDNVALFKMKKFIETKLEYFGYVVNEEKTKIISRNHRQIVCGVVVNDRISMPKERKKRVEALKYLISKGKLEPDLSIKGELAFAEMFHPKKVDRMRKYAITWRDLQIKEDILDFV